MAAIFLCVLLFSIVEFGNGALPGVECTLNPCKVDDKTIRFIVLGDWGGGSVPPYTTPAQLICAASVQNTSKDKDIMFYVSTGDHFYEYGVKNEDDPRFRLTFDDVYLYRKEEQLPWYMSLGNHDWYNNASAQLGYAKKHPRWVFPSYAYSQQHDAHPNGPSVDIIHIDTIFLCGNTWNETNDDADYVESTGREGHKIHGFIQTQAPENVESMWQFIEEQFQKSTADYLFATGHFPCFSFDNNNISDCLVPRLQDMLDKYKAHYISGHAHNMQHMKTIGNSGRTIHHILSGAGHLIQAGYKSFEQRNVTSNPWHLTSEFFWPQKQAGVPKIQNNNGAYLYVEMGLKTANFDYIQCDGTKLYSFQMTARTAL